MAERKKRILWANPYCLLDLSSGASMAVREQLLQLQKRGDEVAILGATIFDSPNGITRLKPHWQKIRSHKKPTVTINDGTLKHRLIKTKSTARKDMTAEEEARWYTVYVKLLDEFKPDLVYYYGGRTLDLLIGDEAHARGIPVAAYLANGNFKGKRWCRDVDLILTDSQATATLYKEREGIDVTPIGPFIDPALVVAEKHDPSNVLLVNPSLAKGAAIVIRLAMLLEQRRPDIPFEVVQSRGDWEALLRQVTRQFGEERKSLSNVTLTPNTHDMRPVYGRARALLALSLWWESFGRVAAEAAMNGVPSIITGRGGLPEAAGAGAVQVDLPDDCFKSPYQTIPADNVLAAPIKRVMTLFDSDNEHQALSSRARAHAANLDLERSAQRLTQAMASCR